MKAHGVERTVIIQVIHYRWDNSYLADVLKQYPQYFRGVARVNPEDPNSPDHLSRLVEQERHVVHVGRAAVVLSVHESRVPDGRGEMDAVTVGAPQALRRGEPNDRSAPGDRLAVDVSSGRPRGDR